MADPAPVLYRTDLTIPGIEKKNFNASNLSRTFPAKGKYPFEFQVSAIKRHRAPGHTDDRLEVELYLTKGTFSHVPSFVISFMDKEGNAISGKTFRGTEKCAILAPGDTIIVHRSKGDLKKSGGFSVPISEVLSQGEPTLIIIHCEVDVSRSFGKFTNESGASMVLRKLRTLGTADGKLRLGEKTFPVHQWLVAAQSSVLAQEFANFQVDNGSEMKMVSPKVEIPDIDEEMGEALVRHFYAQPVHNFDRLAPKLLPVAHKLVIDSLKEACEAKIVQQLDDALPATINSIGSLLVLAQANDATDLMEKAITAFHKHSQQVVRSESWREVCSDGQLMTTIMQALPPTAQSGSRERLHTPPFRVPSSPSFKAKPSGSGWVRSNSYGGAGAANFRPNSRGRSGERPKRE